MNQLYGKEDEAWARREIDGVAPDLAPRKHVMAVGERATFADLIAENKRLTGVVDKLADDVFQFQLISGVCAALFLCATIWACHHA